MKDGIRKAGLGLAVGVFALVTASNAAADHQQYLWVKMKAAAVEQATPTTSMTMNTGDLLALLIETPGNHLCVCFEDTTNLSTVFRLDECSDTDGDGTPNANNVRTIWSTTLVHGVQLNERGASGDQEFSTTVTAADLTLGARAVDSVIDIMGKASVQKKTGEPTKLRANFQGMLDSAPMNLIHGVLSSKKAIELPTDDCP